MRLCCCTQELAQGTCPTACKLCPRCLPLAGLLHSADQPQEARPTCKKYNNSMRIRGKRPTLYCLYTLLLLLCTVTNATTLLDRCAEQINLRRHAPPARGCNNNNSSPKSSECTFGRSCPRCLPLAGSLHSADQPQEARPTCTNL
jgi:hypothetical protein